MKYRALKKHISMLLAALLILTAFPGTVLQSRAAGGTPQAIWTEDNATLTFICADTVYTAGQSFGGETITNVWKGTDLTDSPEDGPAWEGTVDEWAEKVVFEESFSIVKPKRLTCWFEYFGYLTTIEGLQYLDTSEVTDMSNLFRSCNSLESLDLSGFDTAKATSMSGMFARCFALTRLDLQNFNTRNVTDMSEMFYGCSELTVLDLANFDTAKVTAAAEMFVNCGKLQTIYCGHYWDIWEFAQEYYNASVNGYYDDVFFAGDTALTGRAGSVTVTYNAQNVGPRYAASAAQSGYFTPKYMTIRFKKNNGTGTMADVDVLSSFYGGGSTLPENTFTREGYVFTGWNTESDGSGTSYGNKAAIAPTEDLTLYAQWEAESGWRWTRLKGTNRYGTMAAITKEAYPVSENGTLKTLIVATGESFPDALSGSALAGVYGCPIILTKTGSLSPDAKAEIERLRDPSGCTVYILGGTGAVSEAVENAIRTLDQEHITVQRVKGSGRELTAVTVYEQGKLADGGFAGNDTFILTTGKNYADALSISPYAYASRTPVFLTKTDGSLRDTVKAVLLDPDNGFKKAIIVGGTGAVTEETERTLTDEGITVLRLKGSNRYQTSAEIIRWELGLNQGAAIQPAVQMTNAGMGVATGENFADALGSVALLGKNSSVLLLASNAKIPALKDSIAEFIEPYAAEMGKGYIFGGTLAVSEEIEALLNEGVSRGVQPRIPMAQAVWAGDVLTMIYDYPIYQKGDSFKGQTVKDVWFGDEVTEPEGVPDWKFEADFSKMVFDESFSEARPQSLQNWFFGFSEGMIEGLQYLNTSEVTNMSMAFSCSTMASLDLSTFDTSKVEDMSGMFRDAKFEHLNLSGFDTSHVEYMAGMFCLGSYGDLDLSGFHTSSLKSTYMMFAFCGVDTLDLSGWDISHLTDAVRMYDCCNAKTIYCADSDTEWVFREDCETMGFFDGCSDLVGVYGETRVPFDTEHAGCDYAKSARLGGYFTPKN
ncbi:MAG: BspA family leucine-rich repeat surface protein [Lachnospiraceae bacterium]|nr:BspA family leucine-rich repeat surface protein [Lachnospiraceae bacterium]